MPPSSPWFPPLARWALIAGLVSGAVGGASYASWASAWSRPKPKIQRCFLGAKITLRQPETESGTEPHETADGRTVYLTPAADRAVRCAMGLGKEPAASLADAFGEIDPDARAAKLVASMEAIAPDERGDKDAVSMGHLVEAALEGLPRSEVVVASRRRVTEIVDCRFGGSGCQSRPAVPIVAWIGGAGGAVGLLAALGLVGRAAVTRRTRKKDAVSVPEKKATS